MKRFLTLLLAALLLTMPALAETKVHEDLGLSFDFSEVAAKSGYYPTLEKDTLNHEPYVAVGDVYYYALTEGDFQETFENLQKSEGELREKLIKSLKTVSTDIAFIIVSNADSLEAAFECSDESMPEIAEGEAPVEFGTLGEWHYYFVPISEDKLLSVFDQYEKEEEDDSDPQDVKEDVRADIKMVRAELLKQLEAAPLSVPVDADSNYIGQVIQFESTDLDGNAYSSDDLFKDNKVTMVNLWGTWCHNCLNEMDELAELHARLREKGCGVVGVECEGKPLEEFADLAHEVLADYGVTYPNVLLPNDCALLTGVSAFPTSFFVDGEGRILTWPIAGARTDIYESTVDALLAGKSVDIPADTGATANDAGEYRVIVYDQDGNPVKGVAVQMCDDTACSFQKTKEDGVATFSMKAQKVYDVHILKVPEGYAGNGEAYKTLDTFSDVNIFIEKAA